jgi:hypothetical protein
MSVGVPISPACPLPANSFRQGSAFAAFSRVDGHSDKVSNSGLSNASKVNNVLPAYPSHIVSIEPMADTMTRRSSQEPGDIAALGATPATGILAVSHPSMSATTASWGIVQASQEPKLSATLTNSQNPDLWKRVGHVAKALGFFAAVLMLRKFPKGAAAQAASLHSTLIPSDWKEWAKVGLGIAGMSQVNQAANWKPPVWLNAMMNVAVVSPLVSGLSRQHVAQGLILAPVVGALAQATHYVSDKAQRPLQEKWNIPPVVSHAVFSVLMVLASLRIFPWVNSSIPPLQASADGSAVKTGLASACVNGCCSSVICVNDIGQLLAALSRSLFGAGKETGKEMPPDSVATRKQGFF